MFAEVLPFNAEEYKARRIRLGKDVKPKLTVLPRSRIPGVAYEFIQRKNVRREVLNVVDYVQMPDIDPQILVPAERWKQILQEVCEKHKVSVLMIRSKRRSQYIVKARRELCYRLSEETTMSLPQIASKLGYEEHTVVMHHIAKYKAENEL